MTRVTISGDGSYNVYVKVHRRSSNRKKPSQPIAGRPPSMRRQQTHEDDQKRKPILTQLMMDL
jgi:hypothetical protein